jgi:hypothetical protein
MAVQPFVFGEAHHLIGWTLALLVAAVPTAGHSTTGLGGQFVGVQLVAEQDQRVRPVADGLTGHPVGIAVQRIKAQFRVDLVVVGLRISAGPEDGAEAMFGFRPTGPDDAAGKP